MKKHGFYTKCVEVEEYQKVVQKLSAAREALVNLIDVCNDEIKTRSAGLPESKIKNLKVLSLLIVPRNIAAEALKAIGEEA